MKLDMVVSCLQSTAHRPHDALWHSTMMLPSSTYPQHRECRGMSRDREIIKWVPVGLRTHKGPRYELSAAREQKHIKAS